MALVLAGLLGACNWSQLAAFRAQMRAVAEFTTWEHEAAEPIFHFKAPLFALDDLNELGIFPELLDERNAVIRYRRVDMPSGPPDEYDIRLQFTNGRLSGLIFPAKLREGLGRENITRLFAMMGGSEAAGSGLMPVARAQLLSSGLFAGQPEMLGREVVVDLQPLDPRNRPIWLKLNDVRGTGSYGSFHLNLKRRDPG